MFYFVNFYKQRTCKVMWTIYGPRQQGIFRMCFFERFFALHWNIFLRLLLKEFLLNGLLLKGLLLKGLLLKGLLLKRLILKGLLLNGLLLKGLLLNLKWRSVCKVASLPLSTIAVCIVMYEYVMAEAANRSQEQACQQWVKVLFETIETKAREMPFDIRLDT